MSSELRARWRDEQGIALPTAMLAVFALTALMGMIVVTALGQNRAAGFQERYESAVHLAEGAAEVVVLRANADPTFVTTSSSGTPHAVPAGVDVTDDAQLGAWARQQGGTATWLPMPSGRGFGIRPTVAGSPADFVLGVGEDADRTRVVRLDLTASDNSGLAFAILTDGDLSIQGNSRIWNDDTSEGTTPTGPRVGGHSNGSITMGGSGFFDGPVTSSGGYNYGHSYAGPHPLKCNGSDSCSPTRPASGSGGGRPIVPIPTFSARQMYSMHHLYTAANYGPYPGSGPWPLAGEWFDLCPNGIIRLPGANPCTGTPIADAGSCGSALPCYREWPHFEGWQWTSNRWQSNLSRGPFGRLPHWSPSRPDRDRVPAVWYVYRANAYLAGSNGQTPITVIAESNSSDSGQSGNIELGGYGAGYSPFLSGLLMLAERDLVMGASFSSDGFGMALAGEAVSMTGNFLLHGGVIARNDYDTPNSILHSCGGTANCMGGSSRILYDSSMAIPGASSAGPPTVSGWAEL